MSDKEDLKREHAEWDAKEARIAEQESKYLVTVELTYHTTFRVRESILDDEPELRYIAEHELNSDMEDRYIESTSMKIIDKEIY